MLKRFSAVMFILIFGVAMVFPNTIGAHTIHLAQAQEIIVKYKKGVSYSKLNAFHVQNKNHIVSSSKRLNYQVVKVTGKSIQAVINEYKKNPNVEYVEPNHTAFASFVPNDPNYEKQYALKKVHAEEAWDVTKGSKKIIVAIVDTGVDYTHPDLEGKVIKGHDFVDDDDDPMDENKHGTHCAGIAAASTDNGIGIAGMAPKVKILAERVLNKFGSGSYANVAEGITHAADHGANVISLSLGGGFPSQVIEDAVKYATEKGAILIAAAGNSGSSRASYPAYYEDVLSVAATDKNDELASFSNYGDWVDVAAPGVGIYSTVPGEGYEKLSGTSMATPLVAGLAGLLASQGKDASEIRSALENTTDDIGDVDLIHGRVNALKALQIEDKE